MDALRFQLAHRGDDLLLGGLHFLDLDRSERLHVLAQHLRAALRHAAHHVVPQLLAGALQRHREHLAVHLAQDFLQPHGIDEQQVFEDEHQVADGLRDVGSCCSMLSRMSRLEPESRRFNISATARTPP